MDKLPHATNAARRALGETIRQERKRRKFSQEDFAEACGLHRNSIGMIERAEMSVTFDALDAIARALDMKPSQMLARAGL